MTPGSTSAYGRGWLNAVSSTTFNWIWLDLRLCLGLCFPPQYLIFHLQSTSFSYLLVATLFFTQPFHVLSPFVRLPPPLLLSPPLHLSLALALIPPSLSFTLSLRRHRAAPLQKGQTTQSLCPVLHSKTKVGGFSLWHQQISASNHCLREKAGEYEKRSVLGPQWLL